MTLHLLLSLFDIEPSIQRQGKGFAFYQKNIILSSVINFHYLSSYHFLLLLFK